MAKELPYFRFTAQEWQNGLISLEDYSMKGLFIDVCSYYWVQNCSVTKAMLLKKFRNDNTMIEELFTLSIIKHDSTTDLTEITFLNEQFDVLSQKRKRRQEAGRKGGKQKSSNAKAMLKQSSSYKDKDKENNKDNTIPTIEEFVAYGVEKKSSVSTEALRLKYETWIDNGWKVVRKDEEYPIKNWKNTLRNTLPYLKTINNQNIIHKPHNLKDLYE